MEKSKKGKRITLCIGILMLLAAAAVIVLGNMKKTGGGYPALDFFHMTDDQVGQMYSGVMECQPALIGDTDYGCLFAVFLEPEDAEKYIFVGFDVPTDIKKDYDYPGSEDTLRIPYRGTLKKCDASRTNKMQTYVSDYCNQLTEAFKGTEYEDELDPDMKEKALASISPYYVEAVPLPGALLFYVIGIALAVLAVVVIFAALFGRKILLICFGVILLAVIVVLALLFGKLRTMASVRQISDGLYYMDCVYDYDGDKYLDANISTVDGLIRWIGDTQLYGVQPDLKTGNFACAAFTAACDNGDRLFGRNFDYHHRTDTLVLHTAPKNGYASYSVADLRFLDVGKGCAFSGDSLAAKALMLIAPYIPMDGINEKGVGVSILELTDNELHQDNGRSDLLVVAAIRGILDNCASIDEAVDLLARYDIHTFLGHSYHLFLTDRSGRSVIVEWSGNETLITEDNAVTNEVLSPEHAEYNPDWKCRRYDAIKRELEAHQNVCSRADAMQVLSAASYGGAWSGTQWSCIYDLDLFTLDICLDRDYKHVYRFADGKPVDEPAS
ncbi:MAG: linear amide C-N hydrolase [Oscillospiraceae bacterium]|nr:linear amide C-N hydrolase [Oscillospiraceae bacterium]